MLTPKLQDAFNAQINAEFWSAYLYLSMATHFDNEGLNGIANWFKIQFKEEQAHAEIFMNYVNSRGGRVLLAPIAGVDTTWKSVLDAFEATLSHEQKVTALINNLYAEAEAAKDYASRSRLDWFINEQVEEEETARSLVDRLKLIGDDKLALYMLDQELAARVYNIPSPLANNA